MDTQNLTPLELHILEALWNQDRLSIREIQESFPEADRPAYSTVQAAIARMEENGVVKRLRKVGNAQIFSAAITRRDARGRMLRSLLGLFGGKPKFVMAHMVETGDLTLEDIKEAEKLLKERGGKKHE
jgi:predicted transcriptional regulator